MLLVQQRIHTKRILFSIIMRVRAWWTILGMINWSKGAQCISRAVLLTLKLGILRYSIIILPTCLTDSAAIDIILLIRIQILTLIWGLQQSREKRKRGQMIRINLATLNVVRTQWKIHRVLSIWLINLTLPPLYYQ